MHLQGVSWTILLSCRTQNLSQFSWNTSKLAVILQASCPFSKRFCFYFSHLISRSAEPPELSPLSFGGDILNEGDFAQASCIVRKGDQPLAISWSFHGSNITSELGIVITPLGVRGSSLMIPSVGHKHRGTYTCKASNAAGVRTEQVDLNVNGIYKKVKGWHCI